MRKNRGKLNFNTRLLLVKLNQRSMETGSFSCRKWTNWLRKMKLQFQMTSQRSKVKLSPKKVLKVWLRTTIRRVRVWRKNKNQRLTRKWIWFIELTSNWLDSEERIPKRSQRVKLRAKLDKQQKVELKMMMPILKTKTTLTRLMQYWTKLTTPSSMVDREKDIPRTITTSML